MLPRTPAGQTQAVAITCHRKTLPQAVLARTTSSKGPAPPRPHISPSRAPLSPGTPDPVHSTAGGIQSPSQVQGPKAQTGSILHGLVQCRRRRPPVTCSHHTHRSLPSRAGLSAQDHSPRGEATLSPSSQSHPLCCPLRGVGKPPAPQDDDVPERSPRCVCRTALLCPQPSPSRKEATWPHSPPRLLPRMCNARPCRPH